MAPRWLVRLLVAVSVGANVLLLWRTWHSPPPGVAAAAPVYTPAREASSVAEAAEGVGAAAVSERAEWAEALLGADGDTSSFRRMRVAGAPAFWFPVEETLHSAQYILDHEQGNVAFWIDAVRRAQQQQQQQQQHAPTRRCRVIDVGSNGGFYSLLSRALGCEVLAVDAQPRCLQRLASAAAVNGWADGWSTQWTAVSDVRGLTIEVGATKCSGLWAVRDAGWINDESASKTTVAAQPLTDLVADWAPALLRDRPEDAREDDDVGVAVLKVDAEGSEVAVLASALPLLQKRRIHAILGEFVPARTRAISPWPTIEHTLTTMHTAGYRCGPVGGDLVSLEALLAFFRDTTAVGGGSMDWRCVLV
jgi:FkbM family methyltransferase